MQQGCGARSQSQSQPLIHPQSQPLIHPQSQPLIHPQSQHGETSAPDIVTKTSTSTDQPTRSQARAVDQSEQPQLVEVASPISSLPPAVGAVNLDELVPLSVAAGCLEADDDALAAVSGEVGGGSGSGGRGGGLTVGGNRWPRQETLALLKIRSEMDSVFRDASVKGPLWEDVSRKLAEHGYSRSAKKCKEKFENVQKYYKRTKEGRAGRQDGKSYKFFSELEALYGTTGGNTSTHVAVSQPQVPPSSSLYQHANTTATTTSQAFPPPLSVGMGVSNPMPISSFRISPSSMSLAPAQLGTFGYHPSGMGPTVMTTHAAPAGGGVPFAGGISFSSNSPSSSFTGSDRDNDDDDLDHVEPSNTAGSSRKRKRVTSSKVHRMMEFFESLMKQVMQKQELMQQRFLDAIHKRENERMLREEAWKRQEITRLAQEHDLMAEERATSAARDAAIITFLQKITGQTIQLPPPINILAGPPPHHVVPPAPVPTPRTPQPAAPAAQPPPAPPQFLQQQPRHHQQQQKYHQVNPNQQSANEPTSLQIVMSAPEQQMILPSEGGGFEPTSSRWPKLEVLALIKIRSGLESRYQEAGPKGPLWEELSARMQQMGYKRSAKRCKEKWENINKYFKKVKESNKKRPEDAKTCPYFHELDALYRKKVLGSSSTTVSSSTSRPEQEEQRREVDPQPQTALAAGSGTGGEAKKPEDIMKKLMDEHENHKYGQHGPRLVFNGCDKLEEPDHSDNIDQLEEEEEDEDDHSDQEDDERKMSYKIEFQSQNRIPSNNSGSDFPSLAMVQ